MELKRLYHQLQSEVVQSAIEAELVAVTECFRK